MSAARFATQNAPRWFAIVLWASVLGAQTCLVLSPAPIHPDGTASLDLALYTVAGARPAAVQWTFQYPSASIKQTRGGGWSRADGGWKDCDLRRQMRPPTSA